MGIGGLHQEFTDIFRRAFASRVFPPHIVKQMGVLCVAHLLHAASSGEGRGGGQGEGGSVRR